MLGLPSTQQAKNTINKGVDSYNNLNKGAKQAVNMVGLIGTLAAVFAGYKLVTGMGGVFKTITGEKWSEERKAAEVKEKTGLKSELSKEVIKPTISERQAKNIAYGLSQAFLNTQPEWSRNLWDEGTDEDMVYANLKLLRNKADWLLVSFHYGMPRNRSLAAELSYELTVSEMQKARDILLKINVKI